ncbi:MAG: DUF1610 domain-containing protein [Candidatus Aenigmarchaeota archaeon]|nr:DUF1610 domain-containing protein [Candidatus Aenigmarchaeota archaeon]OYT56214.1 MAG: RNA-binding protein [Candidatus Aenigmarchaeota archaeon ex4484_14]RLI96588.1 MAG: RNA-binding protein [Candidatus Aenigmarchaeota archaeon]
MEHAELKCITCGVNIVSEDNFSKFLCPNCGKVEIIRCEKCRRKSNIYRCPKCGFEGP